VDVVVVGAGAFGAWTAFHLYAAGAGVTLVDAYGAAHARSSSGDESRIIRCGYGGDAIYSRWSRRSLASWGALFERLGHPRPPLFHRCGVLWLAGAQDGYAAATLTTLQTLGYPVTRLDASRVRQQYPHLSADDGELVLLEPECGVLMARRAIQLLVSDLSRHGVVVMRGDVMPPRGAGRLSHVATRDGRVLRGDAFVFACGPWLPRVFPDLLHGRIRPTRQVVVYFGPAPGDDRFGPERTPAWVDFAAGIYGVPDLEDRGVKVGIDRHGPPFDPDRDDRVVDAASIESARAWLQRRMPALADAPVVESRVCQYENTATGDFLIDRHPHLDNVWIAGGGSGHGFKHAPAVGEYVAALMQGGAAEPRFGLAGKGTQPRRSVY